MCAIDAEPPTLARESSPTARKEHRCSECARTIRPGERYERVTGLWDGRWSTFTTCAHCRAARVWLEVVCGTWLYGELFQELEEHWNEGYASIPFGRLIVGVKRGWHGGADPVPDGVEEMARAMASPAPRW